MMNRKAWTLLAVTSLVGFASMLPGGAQPTDKPSGVASNQDHPLLGTFIGHYGPDYASVTLFMEKIEDETASGYFLSNGERHDFTGSVAAKSSLDYELHLHEVGAGARGGEYYFVYRAGSGPFQGWWTPSGNWKDTQTFATFQFRFTHPEASDRLLRTADVENLRPEELHQLRQEIYARRGYDCDHLPRVNNPSSQVGMPSLGGTLSIATRAVRQVDNPVEQMNNTALISQDSKTPEKVIADPSIPMDRIGLTAIERSNDALLERYEFYYRNQHRGVSRVFNFPMWRRPSPEPQLTLRNDPLR